MAFVDSVGFDAERLAQGVKLADCGLQLGDLTELKRLFEHATTFGSLIQIPETLAAQLPALKQLSELTSQDLFVGCAQAVGLLVRQAELLAAQYDAVVANPPYMGSKYECASLKKFAKGLLLRCQKRPLRLLHRAWLHTGEGCRLLGHGHHAELDVPVVVRKDAEHGCYGRRPSRHDPTEEGFYGLPIFVDAQKVLQATVFSSQLQWKFLALFDNQGRRCLTRKAVFIANPDSLRVDSPRRVQENPRQSGGLLGE